MKSTLPSRVALRSGSRAGAGVYLTLLPQSPSDVAATGWRA